jgi:hypothetical protein
MYESGIAAENPIVRNIVPAAAYSKRRMKQKNILKISMAVQG